ncbi:Xenobiotic-transporting ATPase [Forsythia ovata]|uniref:Xenobiotic-transporting ATPase n=1 Tax=Forsythia ovata TaxID=205694 RepID=A0ABD1WJ82_9LAMI
MKDGRITQDGKYNDILKSGSDFMELVGAHKEALSALDSIEAGAAVVGEDSSSTGNAKNFLQKKESPTDQNDKTDNAMGTNGQLIQAVEKPTNFCWTFELLNDERPKIPDEINDVLTTSTFQSLCMENVGNMRATLVIFKLQYSLPLVEATSAE